MKLWYDKRLSDPMYYGQQGYRNGNKVTSKNIMKFGKRSELLKKTDDPDSYVKDLIQKWNEEHRKGKVEMHITIDHNQKLPVSDDKISSSLMKNIGYYFIQALMKDLKLKEYFEKLTEKKKCKFNAFDITRFLVYAQILDPKSKLSTWHNLNTYFENPDFTIQSIYRCMDLLEEDYNGYLSWLYRKSVASEKRNTSVMYYDCSNFYCECETEDDTVIDEVTGEVIPGLRKFGLSKQHQPTPIVEMGLFMDADGIPVSMCIKPGNTNEQTTAIPLEKEVLKMVQGNKFIYCADAGLGSYNIRQYNSMGGRAFIVTQSVKKLSDTLKEAVFNDFDYKLLSNDQRITIKQLKTFDKTDKNNYNLYNEKAYKVLIADKVVDLGLYEYYTTKNGNVRKRKAKGNLEQRVIITFSRKMMEYQRTVRNRQIQRAKRLIDINDPEQIKKGPNDIKRFLKRNTETSSGEKVKVSYSLDMNKIAEEEKYDGYYAIATNLEDSVKKILEINQERYKIEECFRIMKTYFNGRPIRHFTAPRIKAHFMIVYTALMVFRLMKLKLENQSKELNDENYGHITDEELLLTLRNLNVVESFEIEYAAAYKSSKTLLALNNLFNIELNYKYYTSSDLKKIIKKFLK